ncbi:protein of unknown function [Magnetospirillum gryphiswaldense MSR-1 v2]|uniref:Uncharacterized protein n=1 Tax=Magnetospirillum gryphiswaldense (strain DSM 6361 / JCM 21280 / NBRC 15271 / MSR-1) TaxID=431944 RepID=V6EW86_MAGGM|nr:hypothetical protein [Magnetospirillum gryphiswaldense]CDK97545.1 protein of unknown function [Magnetospirillum gryphiswaldense MSR-1 v2]
MFSSFQFGLDIATALSVIGASVAFIINQARIRREDKEELRAEKINNHTIRVIEKLSDLIDNYNSSYASFVYSVHKRDGSSDVNLLNRDAQKIIEYCRNIAMPLYALLYASRELKVIEKILSEMKNWNSDLVAGFENNDLTMIRLTDPGRIVGEGIAALSTF